jgi:hypothetical protein
MAPANQAIRGVVLMAGESKGFLLSLRGDNDFARVCLLTLLWIVATCLVNPMGDFPLGDDWAYGWTVKHLLETWDYLPSDWDAANLISQVIFGALFCLPFGFSFTALRISTLILGIIGVVASYGLMREANASRQISFFGALLIALNPLYFVLANTFMTDVPSFTFTILSVYFFVRGINRNSNVEIGAGTLFAMVAILNRQSSLVILPAFGLAYIVRNGLKSRTIIVAVVLNIIGITLYITFSQWLKLSGRMPLLYGFQIDQIRASLSTGFVNVAKLSADNVFKFSIYLGLFLFPFLLIAFSVRFNAFFSHYRKIWMGGLVGVGALAAAIGKYKRMPLTGNTLEFFALGEKPASYQSFLDPSAIAFIKAAWLIFTAIGVFGAAGLFAYLSSFLFGTLCRSKIQKIIRADEKEWMVVFLASLAVLYLLPIAVLPYWYDRYLIPVLPLFMTVIWVLTAGRTGKFAPTARGLAAGLLLCYSVFTITGTHDFLASNRTQWQALRDLMQQTKISPDKINGGFEFNGWYFGNKMKVCNPDFQGLEAKHSDFKCLWYNDRYPYITSYIPETGHDVIATYSFTRWLPFRQQDLYVLRKK